MSYFLETPVNIVANTRLRNPQIEAYLKIVEYFGNGGAEALVILPTGTGKSGVVAIAPFGLEMNRILVITPGLVTKQSIIKTLNPIDQNFWIDFDVILDPVDQPVVVEYHKDVFSESLHAANFVVCNVHRLNAEYKGALVHHVPPDFFDMIIVDEAHHAPAPTWQKTLDYFSSAKRLHLTGTPYRGDRIELPGEIIHRTRLSEVMRDHYVKGLRKETVSNEKLYFTLPGQDKQLTKDEVLAFKDVEWIEKSVALSPECTMDVIDRSIARLVELREASPNVPHKILAVACSIAHADEVISLYQARGLPTVIVHSDMEAERLSASFDSIENNHCHVVVSVNMLMEGYDHKYLSVLALFRPYRSLNAFAQVVGRVLRAIPEDEIVSFDLDNNALVIYHSDIGLDEMWGYFQSEQVRATRTTEPSEVISESEYAARETIYAQVQADGAFVTGQDSYIPEIDFNARFEKARRDVEAATTDVLERMRAAGIDEDTIAAAAPAVRKQQFSKEHHDIDPLLKEKRPEEYRKRVRQILTQRTNDAVQDVLAEYGIDPKGFELFDLLRASIPNLEKGKTRNDGMLVRFVFKRLFDKFGAINDRPVAMLNPSLEYIETVMEEIRRML